MAVVTNVAVFPVNVLYAKQTGFITDTNCVLCEVWEEATERVKHQVQADNSTPIKEVTEYHINIMDQATDDCWAHTATKCVLCEVHMKAIEKVFKNQNTVCSMRDMH